MKTLSILFFLLITSLSPLSSFAQETASTAENQAGRFYIILDHPPKTLEERFPIAVTDLLVLENKKDKDQLSIKISDVIRNDLKMAGYFNVLGKSSYPENPGTTLTREEIDFRRWMGIGARALVKGGLKIDGKHLVMQLRLFDPHTGDMLVGKEYKVEKKAYRAAAHRFMDEIMLALTGEKGIFSTKITAACGKVGEREVYIMDIDGENMVPLTKTKSINVSPNWSPDGTQIAFTSYAKYFPEIFIVPTDGKGKLKRITYNRSMNITPSWAADGSGIAVSSSMSGDPEIYLMDTQGNKISDLTHSFGIDLAPTWSPDAQHLIFASERAGNLQLFSMDRDGTNVRRLSFEGNQNDQPDWSPKGDKVVFARRGGGIFDIYSMNIDGSRVERLSAGPGSNESPSYSPDGRYIVYSSTRAYKTNLYLMLWDGSNSTQVSQSSDCVNPDWSPWLP